MTQIIPANGRGAWPIRANPRNDFSRLDDSVLLSMAETAAVLGISVHTVKSWRHNYSEDRGPQAIKIGRCVRYPVGGIRRWLTEAAEIRRNGRSG